VGSERRVAVSTPKAPSPRFSYSQGIIAQGLLFIAGQVPIDPETGSVAESFADQVRQTLKNLAAVAEAAGGSLADAVRVNVYLEDIDRVREMDAIYRGYFAEPLPARTTIRAGLRGFLVEMDAIVAL
jgi:2-iminobutanoate/2-iminopropanoate deaminase